MRIAQAGVTAVASIGLLVGTAGVAAAYTSTQTVSCDVGVTSTLVTLNQSGTLKATQVSTSPSTNRYYWAVSSSGKALSWKAATDGGTVTWTGVASSNYTWKTRVVSNVNCNGILPGNGNTTLTYTITP